MSDLYQAIIIEEAAQPQNKGSLTDFDVKSSHTNASCGDNLVVQIKLSADKQRVKTIAWQGNGCAISQAAMSVLSGQITGMSVITIRQLNQSNIQDLLGLDQITPGRIKCLMLGLNAVKRALEQLDQH